MVSNLSQGQKQRIAIARAVAKDPGILIFDEACSSLDSVTEDRIMDNIRVSFPYATVIVVTHRLSTVKKMDKVYFIRSCGEICVSNHSVLSQSDPEYRKLFSSQMEDRLDLVAK